MPLEQVIIQQVEEDASHEEFLGAFPGIERARSVAFTFAEVLALAAELSATRGIPVSGTDYFSYVIGELDDQLYVAVITRWIGANINERTCAIHPLDSYPPRQGKKLVWRNPESGDATPIEFSRSFARQVLERDPARTEKVHA